MRWVPLDGKKSFVLIEGKPFRFVSRDIARHGGDAADGCCRCPFGERGCNLLHIALRVYTDQQPGGLI